MATPQDEAPFLALIRKWEGAKDSEALRNVAIRTATMLARIQDVPRDVLSSLDEIVDSRDGGFFFSPRWSGNRAGAIYVVVRYLHGLAELERLLTPTK